MGTVDKRLLVKREAKILLDDTTRRLTDVVLKLSDEDVVDWEVFLNLNLILIDGLMIHFSENHNKNFDKKTLTTYHSYLADILSKHIDNNLK